MLPDGSLAADGAVIRLDAVALPDRKRLCRSENGTRWPCGSIALVALRNLLASTTLSCELDRENNLTGKCKAGTSDISVMMLEQGWADLREPASPVHHRAAATAKANQVGLWATRPPTPGRQ
jgi:endonuclease YncB( thermonuclease family)